MEIIINADDFGLTKEANTGIAAAFEEGYCSQTTLVPNGTFVEEAVELANEKQFNSSVGLHLNLCEEQPLTERICQFDCFVKKGVFHYTPVFLDKTTAENSPILYYLERLDTDWFEELILALSEEIEAQIIRFIDFGFTLKHIDSHRNSLADLPVWLAAKPLLKKYGFKTLRGLYSSFPATSLMNQIYAGWLKQEHSHITNSLPSFIGSIPRYQEYRYKLEEAKLIELYIHPIWKNQKLIDNFTGGKTVPELFETLPLKVFQSLSYKNFQ